MRSRNAWLSAVAAFAGLTTACETARDHSAYFLLIGGIGDFATLADARGLAFALILDTSGDTGLTPGMRERLHWTDAGIDQ